MTAAPREIVFGRASPPHTIVIARGDRIRHWTVRPWVLAAGVAAFGVAALSLVGSTALFLLSDRVSDALRSREAASVSAYERRISDLRGELDRMTTRQHVERDAVSREIQELLAQQKELEDRFERLTPLLRRAEDAGLVPQHETGSAPEERAQAPAPTVAEGDPLRMAENVLPALRRSVDAIGEEQSVRIVALANEAQDKARKMAELLDRFGIKAPPGTEPAIGGPFVEGGDAFAESLDQLDQALDLIGHLRRKSAGLPLGRPIVAQALSSSFGFRTDPFLGRRAMHTGLDFPAPTGTAVFAAAGGTVTTAGESGGYGLMVEIDHGNGITTRYGHLSRIEVRPGQTLEPGARLGRVGSTGRSTGPHLHYEVRRDDHPVNPQRYLDAGKRMAELR